MHCFEYCNQQRCPWFYNSLQVDDGRGIPWLHLMPFHPFLQVKEWESQGRDDEWLVEEFQVTVVG